MLNALLIAALLGGTKANLVLDMPLTSAAIQSATVASDLAPMDGRNTGTAAGTPAPTFAGDGVDLDGDDQHIDLGDVDAASATDGADNDLPISMCAWVYPDSSTGFRIASKGEYTVDAEWSFILGGGTGDDLTFWMIDHSAGLVRIGRTNTTGIPTGAWAHVCATYSGSESSSGINLYYNGADWDNANFETSPGSYVGVENLAGELYIGRQASSGASTYANGKISYFKLWNQELSATEILDEYNDGRKTIVTTPGELGDSLVLDMPLTSGYIASSTVASDLAPLGGRNTGVSTGTPAAFTATGIVTNGTDDHIVIADDDIFSFTDGAGNDSAFSVGIWANITDPVSERGSLVAKDSTSSGTREWLVYVTSTDFFALTILNSTGTTSIAQIGNASVSSYYGSFHHWVATYDGSETAAGIKLYIDGNLIASSAATTGAYGGMSNTAQPVHIARTGTQYTAGTYSFTKIWRKELTAVDVLDEYNNGRKKLGLGANTISDNLVGWWPLTSGFTQSATVASDRSVYRAPATLSGTPPSFAADGVTFNGSSDFVDLTPVDLSAGATYSFWVKAPDVTTVQAVVANTSAANNRNNVYIGNGLIGGAFYDGATRDGKRCAITINTWYHVAVTRTGTTAQTYVNGVACATVGAGVGNDTAEHFIGKNTGGSLAWFGGTVADYKIWSRVLSPTDILDIYNCGLNGCSYEVN